MAAAADRIIPADGAFDYWGEISFAKATQEICPGDLRPKSARRSWTMALKAQSRAVLRAGYSRTDFIVSRTDHLSPKTNTLGIDPASFIQGASRPRESVTEFLQHQIVLWRNGAPGNSVFNLFAGGTRPRPRAYQRRPVA